MERGEQESVVGGFRFVFCFVLLFLESGREEQRDLLQSCKGGAVIGRPN